MRTLREEIIACAEGQVRDVARASCPCPHGRDGDPGPQPPSSAAGSPTNRAASRLGTQAHAAADQGYELTFRPGDDFIGFQGHFPGHPVLPAFVQLLMAECAVRLHSGVPLSLRRIERGKFLRPIGPNEPVTVCWQEQARGEGLHCSFTLRAGAEKAAIFALEFTIEEGGHA